MKPMIIKKGEKLTMNQARLLLKDVTADEQRAYIEKRGPWSIITRFVALCVSMDFETGDRTIYGYRTLSKPRESGYQLEGYVSIAGKTYSAFTTSQLFELEDGHLIDVATIFPRVNK